MRHMQAVVGNHVSCPPAAMDPIFMDALSASYGSVEFKRHAALNPFPLSTGCAVISDVHPVAELICSVSATATVHRSTQTVANALRALPQQAADDEHDVGR